MSDPLRFLVIDGYVKASREEVAAGGASTAGDLYTNMLRRYAPDAHCDVVYPSDPGTSLPSGTALADYDGIAWTGCSLTAYDSSPEVRNQIDFCRAGFEASVVRANLSACQGVWSACPVHSAAEIYMRALKRRWLRLSGTVSMDRREKRMDKIRLRNINTGRTIDIGLNKETTVSFFAARCEDVEARYLKSTWVKVGDIPPSIADELMRAYGEWLADSRNEVRAEHIIHDLLMCYECSEPTTVAEGIFAAMQRVYDHSEGCQLAEAHIEDESMRNDIADRIRNIQRELGSMEKLIE